MRAINTATIAFGLVSVPVKIYAANSPHKISLNNLTPNGNRVKQQYIDSVTGEVVSNKELTSKGYEYAKDKYITFTAEELAKLDADSDSSIEIKEFVPAEEISPLRVEKPYLVGTNGGDKSYSLLAKVMEDNWVVAIGQWKARKRDHLVAIAPIKNNGIYAMVMYQLYYQDEHRHIDNIGVSGCDASEAEIELASKILETKTTSALTWSKYQNGYIARLQKCIEAKLNGDEVQTAPDVPDTQIIDLYEALKQSVEQSNSSNPTLS